MASSRPVLRAAVAVVVLAALPLSCRQIIGIPDREEAPDAAGGVSCATYCNTVQASCVGPNLQYEDVDACLALCGHIPLGTASDMGVDTIGCRLNSAITAASTAESGDCDAAGPGGNGTCGTNCQSFCAAAYSVCPGDFGDGTDAGPGNFTDMAACAMLCAELPSVQPYYVDPNVTPNADSIQCRLYHLTAASIAPVPHCQHVKGQGLCEHVTDGGTDGG
jgi:hypothetical protein